MAHTLSVQCDCGAVKGAVRDVSPKRGTHVICYCKDCQAFAHFLGRADSVLDANGGSHIFQTLPSRLSFSEGVDNIRSVRVTHKGIYRWYADCCKWPIGNTASSPDMPFVGLLSASLHGVDAPKDEIIGPVRAAIAEKSAHGSISQLPPKAGIGLILNFLTRTFGARLRGDTASPFFHKDKTPIAEPHTLTGTERTAVDEKITAGAAYN